MSEVDRYKNTPADIAKTIAEIILDNEEINHPKRIPTGVEIENRIIIFTANPVSIFYFRRLIANANDPHHL